MEMLDCATLDLKQITQPPVLRTSAAWTILPGGAVLFAGGFEPKNVRHRAAFGDLPGAELFDSVSETWKKTSDLTVACVGYDKTLLTLKDGRALLICSSPWNVEFTASAQVYNPRTDLWHAVPGPKAARSDYGTIVRDDGRVMIFGGNALGGLSDSTEKFDPTTETWSPGPAIGRPILRAGSLKLGPNRWLIEA